MRDERFYFVALIALVSHVACLASTNASAFHNPYPSSHNSSLISHSSYLITHPSSLISVTNHAGRVVSGEFGGVTNNTFIVSGRAYPLSVLPKSEQTRVKKLAGCDTRTAKEKRLDHDRQMRLERIRLREAEGEIDKSTADRLRRELGPARH